jgi:hypothetical protein
MFRTATAGFETAGCTSTAKCRRNRFPHPLAIMVPKEIRMIDSPSRFSKRLGYCRLALAVRAGPGVELHDVTASGS